MKRLQVKTQTSRSTKFAENINGVCVITPEEVSIEIVATKGWGDNKMADKTTIIINDVEVPIEELIALTKKK